MTVQAVLAILLVKAIIWLVALSSGTSGGVLAPLLILGGALGWLVGLFLPGEPAIWALLGMAAMMGGTMRAPLTGMMFAVELTGDFHLLLPIFIATVSAYAVTVLLLRRSILTEKIARRGQHITREYGTDPFELTRASDIMVRKVATLAATMPVSEAIAFFEDPSHPHRAYPIVDEAGGLVGMAERADALRWRGEGRDLDQTLYDFVSDASVPAARADDTVGQVTDLMIAQDIGRVPVVEPETGRLVGLIARKDLLRLRSAAAVTEAHREAFFRRAARRKARARKAKKA
jgi:CBS domain-containing protein